MWVGGDARDLVKARRSPIPIALPTMVALASRRWKMFI
jgi:hypothetical protein